MLVTTTFKIEKKNVDFSRVLFIKIYDVFCISRQNDWQNMEKKLFYKKGNIVEILYMSGSSKTHV